MTDRPHKVVTDPTADSSFEDYYFDNGANSTPQPDLDELREEILKLNGMCNGPYDTRHRCSALHCNHCGICDMSEDLLSILTSHTEKAVSAARIEAMSERFKDYLDSLDVTEAVHLLGVTAYLYCMEPTNATEFQFKLSGFNRNGKVLGDLVIKAELQATNPEGGEDE